MRKDWPNCAQSCSGLPRSKNEAQFRHYTPPSVPDTNHGFEDVISVQIGRSNGWRKHRNFSLLARALVPVMEMGDIPIHIMWGREGLDKVYGRPEDCGFHGYENGNKHVNSLQWRR